MNVVIIIYLNLSIHRETEGKQLASSGSISSSRLLSSLPCHQETGSMPRNTSFMLPQASYNLVFLYSSVKPTQAHLHPEFCQDQLHTNVSITGLASEGISQTAPRDWGLQIAEARGVDGLMATLDARKWELVDPLFHTHAYKPGPSQSTFYKIF